MKKVVSFILTAMLFLGCIQTNTYAAEVNPTPADAATQEAGVVGIDSAYLGLPCNHCAWIDGESQNIINTKYDHVYSNGYHETSDVMLK